MYKLDPEWLQGRLLKIVEVLADPKTKAGQVDPLFNNLSEGQKQAVVILIVAGKYAVEREQTGLNAVKAMMGSWKHGELNLHVAAAIVNSMGEPGEVKAALEVIANDRQAIDWICEAVICRATGEQVPPEYL